MLISSSPYRWKADADNNLGIVYCSYCHSITSMIHYCNSCQTKRSTYVIINLACMKKTTYVIVMMSPFYAK